MSDRLTDADLTSWNSKMIGHELARTIADRRLSMERVPITPPDILLTSKMCTQADIESDWCAYWTGAMKCERRYHRKVWELAYVAQVLHQAGKLAPGMRGLGFGCGTERLPALFAAHGARVLATDLAADDQRSQGWIGSGQHSAAAAALHFPEISKDGLDRIEFRVADMTAIPPDLTGFDFTWSTCALEHLGSLQAGTDFIANSLRTLKFGGIAVHTLEFNLDDRSTLESGGTVLYQWGHLVALVARLKRDGYVVRPLDPDRGSGFLDGFIDVPPYPHQPFPLRPPEQIAHLKLSVAGYPCTSFGIIVEVPL